MQEDSLIDLDSSTPTLRADAPPGLKGWLRVGAIAAASAVAGGLAAAWYYRKTLDRLREAESSDENSNFDMPDDENEV
jgi:hypothetical protein